jgi:hypothetical protein
MNNFRNVLLISAVVILACGVAFALNVSFTVEVIDGNNGNPVAGADVSLTATGTGPGIFPAPLHQQTNGDGVAVFPSVPEGQYSMVVVADGYTTYSEVVTIGANKRRRQIAVF